jgi:catechol-2,3-dioxygenase
MIQVRRLGHATLSTADLEKQATYYTDVLGLRLAERTKDRAILVSKQGFEVIELVNGAPGQPIFSFQITPGTDLNDVVKELVTLGIKSEKRSDISPSVAEAVTFTDPNGIPIDVYAEYKVYERAQPANFNILKLGHAGYHVLDMQQAVKFYSEVLGFRVSDWRGDFFVFLRCNTDHHALNFVTGDSPRLHHLAFEVIDWSEVNKFADWLARNQTHLVWGPGRHIIGHNVAAYTNTPDGVRVELYCELDQMKDEALGYFEPRPWHQEVPLYPKMHGPETLRNYWGVGSQGPIKG